MDQVFWNRVLRRIFAPGRENMRKNIMWNFIICTVLTNISMAKL
jgi:hypothetical protein